MNSVIVHASHVEELRPRIHRDKLSDSNTVRVIESHLFVTVQIRFEKRIAQAKLTRREARKLGQALLDLTNSEGSTS